MRKLYLLQVRDTMLFGVQAQENVPVTRKVIHAAIKVYHEFDFKFKSLMPKQITIDA